MVIGVRGVTVVVRLHVVPVITEHVFGIVTVHQNVTEEQIVRELSIMLTHRLNKHDKE